DVTFAGRAAEAVASAEARFGKRRQDGLTARGGAAGEKPIRKTTQRRLMKNNRKQISSSIDAIAATSLMTLSACRSVDGGAHAEGGGEGFGELTLQLSLIKNAQNAGEYVADDKGDYTDEGITSVNRISGPTAVEASVATKKADVGYSTPLGTASVIEEEDMPLTIIGATYKANAVTVMTMEGENSIRTPEDLK